MSVLTDTAPPPAARFVLKVEDIQMVSVEAGQTEFIQDGV
jgi:hypothetical protein